MAITHKAEPEQKPTGKQAKSGAGRGRGSKSPAVAQGFAEVVPLADTQETEAGSTWGAKVVAQWRKEGILGPVGDMSKDSSEIARELRRSLEAHLFPDRKERRR